MPIEIREMIIRATVEGGRERSSGRDEQASAGQGGQGVNDCLTKMEEISKMIQEKNER